MKHTEKYNFDGTIFVPSESFFVKTYANVNDLRLILQTISNSEFKANNKGLYYLNIPCAFDIETTSFERGNGEKLATMYIWQLGINGYIILGRTWTEFIRALNIISEYFALNENKRIIIYVHNLSFEFQFMRYWFEWSNVFSIEKRRPVYAVTKGGVEFRCSYLLSGYSLETVAKNLTKYKCKKLVGNLDYNVKRHYLTELTNAELDYCVNDIKIVMLYIKEYLENVRNIHSIPLTKTGAVRKFCRKNCMFIKTENKVVRNYDYKKLIKSLSINSLSEFNAMQRAFCGGFTHANANYVATELKNVSSYDFTSSYPAVMVSEKYPCSHGIKLTVENEAQFYNLISKYCCIFDIEFYNIIAKVDYENYISTSKCWKKEAAVENNGRLVCAKYIAITLTEIDFLIIRKMYNFSEFRIGYCYIYEKNYLPSEFVKSILELYKKKTELKGVDGMENEYLNSKEMLNSCYGMCVTNPLRDTITYTDNVWGTEFLNDKEKFTTLLNYNKSDNRFLFYLWGVYVTAYARYNLFTAISTIKSDYVYADTDSIKFLNIEKHKKYFDNYNITLRAKLQRACEYHNIDFALCNPQTKNGVNKLLGAWDFEGTYKRFKTLGAKRYMVEIENALNVNGTKYDYSLTVSGINKKKTLPFLLQKYGKNGIFAAFNDYLYIPPEYSGKNILTYFDYEFETEFADENGVIANIHEKSGVNISNSEYTLNLSVLFVNYLRGIREFKN